MNYSLAICFKSIDETKMSANALFILSVSSLSYFVVATSYPTTMLDIYLVWWRYKYQFWCSFFESEYALANKSRKFLASWQQRRALEIICNLFAFLGFLFQSIHSLMVFHMRNVVKISLLIHFYTLNSIDNQSIKPFLIKDHLD